MKMSKGAIVFLVVAIVANIVLLFIQNAIDHNEIGELKEKVEKLEGAAE